MLASRSLRLLLRPHKSAVCCMIEKRRWLALLDRSASAKYIGSSIHDIRFQQNLNKSSQASDIIATFCDQLFSFHLCEHLGHV